MDSNKRTCGHIHFKDGAGSALIKCPDCELELREQLAKEIEATCNGSGDSEMGGYGKYFANLVRGKG